MNSIITDVVRVVKLVDKRFYELPNIAFSDNDLIERNENRKLERRFMTEFARIYANHMKDNACLYEGVEYDFEVPKQFMWGTAPDIAIRATWEKLNQRRNIDMVNYFETQPDFLVHAGQSKKNDPRLIIEAKVNPTASKDEVFKDIFHIFIYANKYNFQNNVLLLINRDLERWLRWLSEYRTKNFYLGNMNRWESIYLVNKKSFDSPIIVETIATHLLRKD